MLAKREQLQGSTLGSLIKILQDHTIAQQDLDYLRWLREKRDYFVHRLFHEGAWPGDMSREGCRLMTRRLLAIQLLMSRGHRTIWRIFERAGLVDVTRLPDGSVLVTNKDLHKLLA